MTYNTNKIVIKIGTSSLTYPNGKLNLRQIKKLSEVCTNLRNSGKEVIIVSSGAIGAGIGLLGLTEKPTDLEMKQAVASIGQAFLIQLYQRYFSDYGQICSQILLTERDVTDQLYRHNIIRTLRKLNDINVIPIVNENDTVSTNEIEGKVFSDNDKLASIVSIMTKADLLILLSDVDGLYKTDNGKITSELINVVTNVDEVYSNASSSKSKLGSGGMSSKLEAIKAVNKKGINAVICNSNNMELIYDCIEQKNGEKYTYFSRSDSL